ncbi:helix-turn-helix domain-containing protein [Clostridioides difficile]|nr:helix-turn-helix domain-containing protein [Clostridioides difficile]
MIVVEKAYKFRMYPNKKQQELINLAGDAGLEPTHT